MVTKQQKWVKSINRNLKDMAPALILLYLTVLFFFIFGDWDQVHGWQAVYRALFRFIKLSLYSCLSLAFLSSLYSILVKRLRDSLLILKEDRQGKVDYFKHWFFRPFQGIGIGLLFGTRLLAFLQIVAVAETDLNFIIQAHFQFSKIIVIFMIIFFASLILAVFWTLDDMGIRYYNRKDQELKMIGKYIGTLMPMIFGSYGILSLFASFPKWQATIYLFRVIVVLYPPFTLFTVLHFHFIKGRVESFGYRDMIKKGHISKITSQGPSQELL